MSVASADIIAVEGVDWTLGQKPRADAIAPVHADEGRLEKGPAKPVGPVRRHTGEIRRGPVNEGVVQCEIEEGERDFNVNGVGVGGVLLELEPEHQGSGDVICGRTYVHAK